MGAGTSIDIFDEYSDYAGMISGALGNDRFSENAGIFSKKYSDFDQQQQSADIAGRIEGLVT